MTHDPMCQVQAWTPLEQELDGNFYCQCALIAKVRADERNKIFTHLDKLADNDHVDWCRDITCGGCYKIEDDE